MNKEEILRMAREVGDCLTDKRGREDFIFDCYGIERFAALVEAAVDGKWKQAVIDELVNCHIYKKSHDDSPREALHDAICWNVEVALDPKVSSSAEALIRQGAAAEREACAKVCEEEPLMPAILIADAIRARGQV